MLVSKNPKDGKFDDLKTFLKTKSWKIISKRGWKLLF